MPTRSSRDLVLSRKVWERAGEEAVVLSIDFSIVARNYFVPMGRVSGPSNFGRPRQSHYYSVPIVCTKFHFSALLAVLNIVDKPFDFSNQMYILDGGETAT